MDKISVIVPVYNVEQYLDECVLSIANQTHKNIEIILVDDGSTDNSPRICDEWAKRDSRVVVLHKENGGAAAARNAGLDIATGDYIGFADSDDVLCTDMYEILLSSLKKGNKKLACCLTNFIFEDGSIASDARKEDSDLVLDVREALDESFYKRAGNAVWCKLHEKTLFDNMRFIEGGISEDFPVIIPSIVAADGMVLVRRPLYYYRKRSGSITSRASLATVSLASAKAVLSNLSVMEKQVVENKLSCRKSFNFFRARVAFSMALTMEKAIDRIDEEVKTELKRYKKLMGRHWANFLFSKHASTKDKVLYLLVLSKTLRLVYRVTKKDL
ncbi:MAG: glycosyltransferase [Ruminococcaceae bacterium]|nr:glycosyltransferase [Oscillospiraceae bacterium]